MITFLSTVKHVLSKDILKGNVEFLHPELVPIVHEDDIDEGKAKEVIGTAATSIRVLMSNKIVGNPKPNPVRQEWMQRRNKYQRDKRGRVTALGSGNEVALTDGKAKGISTSNTFEALANEEQNSNDVQGTRTDNRLLGKEVEKPSPSIGETITHAAKKMFTHNPKGLEDTIVEGEKSADPNEIVETQLHVEDKANLNLNQTRDEGQKENVKDWVNKSFDNVLNQ